MSIFQVEVTQKDRPARAITESTISDFDNGEWNVREEDGAVLITANCGQETYLKAEVAIALAEETIRVAKSILRPVGGATFVRDNR